MIPDYESDKDFMAWITAKEAEWQQYHPGYYDLLYLAFLEGRRVEQAEIKKEYF